MSALRTPLIQGVYTALVTPFTSDGERVDFPCLEALVEAQIEAGVSGLVPVGTTGECPTLSHEEHEQVISCVVKRAAGRCQVIAGTGSNSTREAIRLTKFAKEAGADAALIVNPYYNKPGQEGLYLHFKAIAAVGLPIMLYNIPGRTGITMSPATVARLYADIPEIIAIKEATGSLEIASEIASLCPITILSGDDSLTLPLMSIGGKGVVSVLSNLSPEKIKGIVDPALAGDFAAAAQEHVKNFKLMKTMFLESNPQPVKEAMFSLRMCQPTCRLPLCNCSEETKARITSVMKEYGYNMND